MAIVNERQAASKPTQVDPKTGKPVTMADARTNHFPFKNVFEIGKHYTDLGFRDFKHSITGALLSLAA